MLLTTSAFYSTLRLPSNIVAKLSTAAPKRLDMIGSAALFVAVALPIFAINLGGDVLPWNHPVEIALLIFAPLGVILFYLVETRVASHPIIPMRFIRLPPVIAVLACYSPIVCTFNQVDPTLLEVYLLEGILTRH